MCGAVHVRGVEIGAERTENRVRGGGTVSVVYYRAMLCISGTIHSPVSVCVRHKSVFDRNG